MESENPRIRLWTLLTSNNSIDAGHFAGVFDHAAVLKPPLKRVGNGEVCGNTAVRPSFMVGRMAQALDRSNCAVARLRGQEASVKPDEGVPDRKQPWIELHYGARNQKFDPSSVNLTGTA